MEVVYVEAHNPNEYKNSHPGEVVVPWDEKWVQPIYYAQKMSGMQKYTTNSVHNTRHDYCREYLKHRRKEKENQVSLTVSKQVHNHENMLKFSGSVMTNHCDKTSIEKNDLVYVHTDALYQHPTSTGEGADHQ